jgi:predicted phage tail protein
VPLLLLLLPVSAAAAAAAAAGAPVVLLRLLLSLLLLGVLPLLSAAPGISTAAASPDMFTCRRATPCAGSSNEHQQT